MCHGATEARGQHSNFLHLGSMRSGCHQGPSPLCMREVHSLAQPYARERQRIARRRIFRSVSERWGTLLGQRSRIHPRQLAQRRDRAQLPTIPCPGVVNAEGARRRRTRIPRRGAFAPSERGTGAARGGQSRTLESSHRSRNYYDARDRSHHQGLTDTAAVVRDLGIISAGQTGDRVGAAAAIMMGL